MIIFSHLITDRKHFLKVFFSFLRALVTKLLDVYVVRWAICKQDTNTGYEQSGNLKKIEKFINRNYIFKTSFLPTYFINVN